MWNDVLHSRYTVAWGPESFSLPNAGKRNELCPCFYQCWRHNVAHIVRISHYSQWPQENNRNSKKTRRWQDLCLTLHLQRGEQIERDYRHQTRSATLVALSPLPPKTEQSIEPVQRNRQRGEWGLSMITLEGQWWVKNASLVLIIKPLLSRSSLFPKKKNENGLKSQSLPMTVCFIWVFQNAMIAGIDLLGSGIQTHSLVVFAIAHYG